MTGTASAQLFLEEGKKVLAVSGGDHLEGSLLIHNTGSDTASMKVYWEDFQYNAPYDGTKKFLPAGTLPGSMGTWVSFTPQVFTMPGFGQQKINYSITIPATVHEGHYGVLFFERAPAPMEGKEDIGIAERVGCLFFIEPKDKNKNALLQNITTQDRTVALDFVNQGNIILIPHTTYYVMPDNGMVLKRGDVNKAYVPPGASANIKIELKDKLNPGHYTLVVNSDLDEGDVVVKEIGLDADASGHLSTSKS